MTSYPSTLSRLELAEEYRARAAALERQGQEWRRAGDPLGAAELEECAVAYVAAAEELEL